MSNFKEFKMSLQKHIENMLKDKPTLFLTDIEKDTLWETYLESFPPGTNEIFKERREFDCNCCKQFVRPFANLVIIKDKELVSIWDVEDAVYPFDIVSKEMSKLVKSANVKDVFVTNDRKLGTDKNRQLLDNGKLVNWNHLYFELPKEFVNRSNKSIGSIKGSFRDAKNVFYRSMEELTLYSGQTVLELIEQNSLYNGLQFKGAVMSFIKYKKQYEDLSDSEKDNWCWANSINNPVAKIRNNAMGTLLIDISNDLDLNVAVKKWDHIMAPTNYKRPKEIFDKKAVERAENKVIEMGYQDSLARRFARIEDISANNILFADRDVKGKLNQSVFDQMKEEVPENIKKFNKVEEISIEDFISKIIPTTTSMRVLMESKHQGNLMSLVAPVNKEAPSMFKWNSPYSWAYNGDVTDSMKQNVKNAGGNVDGVLRFSIQWNDGDNNQNDFDAHCLEPTRNLIYYSNKGRRHPSSGMLDVDIVNPGRDIAVENIIYTSVERMPSGDYLFLVHNYSHNGGRTGFTAEIEFNGHIHKFAYNKELKQGEKVKVATVNLSQDNIFSIKSHLDSSVSSKEIWGVNTEKFAKVSVAMLSPNYWDSQKSTGNKHYFFILEDCKNDNNPRGFYNEFLKEDLLEHKRVFEALGSRMRVKYSDQQLSGLGFSSTIRNSVIVEVTGSFKKTLKINF